MPATTDPQDEQFEVLTPDGRPTGVTRPRREIHRDGHWHRALHIWIWGIDEGDERFMLFQRRSETKDTWPGSLDVAVGGHVREFDTIEETLREGEEELGLVIDPNLLIRAGRRFASYTEPAYTDNEIEEVYIYRVDSRLDEYRLHPEEVAGVARFPLESIASLYRDETDTITGRERTIDGHERPIHVSRTDFVPDPDGYTLAVVERIEAFAAGQTIEPFELQPNDM